MKRKRYEIKQSQLRLGSEDRPRYKKIFFLIRYKSNTNRSKTVLFLRQVVGGA